MAKEKMFFLCDISQGTGRDTAYLEERGAVLDKSVELEPDSGNFWIVTSVASKGITETEMKKLQDHSHKGWAKSIDI